MSPWQVESDPSGATTLRPPPRPLPCTHRVLRLLYAGLKHPGAKDHARFYPQSSA